MKRVLCWIGVLAGGAGFVICLASLVAVWFYYPQLNQQSREIHSKIDEALVQVQERIDTTRDHVVNVNEMTVGYRQDLTLWLNERHLDHQHIGHRAEIIAGHLHRVRDGIDFAMAFLQKIQNAQRLAHPFREHSDAIKLDSLIEELIQIQDQVIEVVDSVDEIRQQAETSGDTSQLEATIENSIVKTLNVLQIIDSADQRLDKLSDRAADAQLKAESLESTILRDLWWTRLGASVFFPWMALGQIALCVVSLRRMNP